jgi:hypothetical protein
MTGRGGLSALPLAVAGLPAADGRSNTLDDDVGFDGRAALNITRHQDVVLVAKPLEAAYSAD